MTKTLGLRWLGTLALVAAFAGGPPTATAQTRDMNQAPLRGFSVGRANAPARLDADHFSALGQTQSQVVRVMLDLVKCKGCTGYERVPAQTAYLAELVKQARVSRMAVVINFAPQPGGRAAEYWSDPLQRASITQHWEAVAREFAGDPLTVYFDLINEPIEPRSTQLSWRDWATQMVDAIRKIDPRRGIVFEPSPGALPRGFKDLLPLDRPAIVYSVHSYEPHEFTHQGLDEHPGEQSYPGRVGLRRALWDRSALQASLAPVVAFAAKHRVPIYVGEFSAIRWADPDSRHAYLKDSIELFDAAGWSWTYHAYREAAVWDLDRPTLQRGDKRGQQSAVVRSGPSKDAELVLRCIQSPMGCKP